MRLFIFHAVVLTFLFNAINVGANAPMFEADEIGVPIIIPAVSGGGECWPYKSLGKGQYGRVITCACRSGM